MLFLIYAICVVGIFVLIVATATQQEIKTKTLDSKYEKVTVEHICPIDVGPGSLYQIEIKHHLYLVLTDNHSRMTIVHDESCPCMASKTNDRKL